jgi:hypothetical protein
MKASVELCVFEHSGELRKLRSALFGNDVPLCSSSLCTFLSEDRVNQRQHHLPLALAGVGESIAHEVHAAPLPRRLENLSDRRFQSEMRIGDHQLHSAQAASC